MRAQEGDKQLQGAISGHTNTAFRIGNTALGWVKLVTLQWL
jgi:hypothetical protein